MALHADLMMVAVPNIFTRNQLEVRFRTDIEGTLAEFFGRNVHLAVLVDDSLETGDGSTGYVPPSQPDADLETDALRVAADRDPRGERERLGGPGVRGL